MSSGFQESRSSTPVLIEQVRSAERVEREAAKKVAGAQHELSEIHRLLRRFEWQMRRENVTRSWVMPVRKFFESFTTVICGYLCCIVVVAGISIVFGSALDFSRLSIILLALAPSLFVGVLGLPLLRWNESECDGRLAVLNSNFTEAKLRLEQAKAALSYASSMHASAWQRFDSVRRQFESRLNQLRLVPWRDLTGVEFEEFLASIFREYGFSVETTKTTGDQGVDLVVSKAGRRIAIQAKGYPKTTVGNKAVQEAHTGMSHYGCHAAAVITNSRFTKGAIELASSVNCCLVSGESIPDLIEGRIVL